MKRLLLNEEAVEPFFDHPTNEKVLEELPSHLGRLCGRCYAVSFFCKIQFCCSLPNTEDRTIKVADAQTGQELPRCKVSQLRQTLASSSGSHMTSGYGLALFIWFSFLKVTLIPSPPFAPI
jgi:hypothetical protein